MNEPELCSAVVAESPTEYCENEAVEGEDFCPYHLADEPDLLNDDVYRWPFDFEFDPLEDL